MRTVVETLLAVLDIGGKLSPAAGDTLRATLPPNCPPELKAAIRVHKAALRELSANLNFVVVRSDVLPPPLLIWAATDHDRDLLIAHGASPETVYTYDELEIITRTNPDPQALSIMHRCKALFCGRFFHFHHQRRTHGSETL